MGAADVSFENEPATSLSEQQEPATVQMDRVLSFSNGIASTAGGGVQEECRSSSSDSDAMDAAFSFARVENHGFRSSIYEEADPKHRDFVAVLTTDEEFERDFRDGVEQTTAAKKTEFEEILEDISSTGEGDDGPLLQTILRTLFYVLVWYIFSTCLTLYNKLLLGKKYGQFPAPLMMNTIHFSMQAVVSTLLLRFCCPSFSPKVSMSWRDYFVRVIPTGVATALDVDLTNAALVFISVTFATMCKSATPVFLLFFAFIFKLETPSFKLFGIIFIISCGVLLTVAKETQFILSGFILVMLAALSSGFRWVVTQLLLQKEEYGLGNPLAAMSYFTPVMAIVTAIFSLILEPWRKLAETPYFNTRAHLFESCMLMLLGGSLAFFMVMAEYLLISKTSAVTMTVAGVVKEVVTVVVAVLYFHDEFTLLKGIGFIIIVIGVSLFNWFKYQTLVQSKAHKSQHQGIEFSSTSKYTILEDESSQEETAFRKV